MLLRFFHELIASFPWPCPWLPASCSYACVCSLLLLTGCQTCPDSSTCTLDRFGIPTCTCNRPFFQATAFTCDACPFNSTSLQESPCYFSSCTLSNSTQLSSTCCRNITSFCLSQTVSYSALDAGCQWAVYQQQCRGDFYQATAVVTGPKSTSSSTTFPRRLADWQSNSSSTTVTSTITVYAGSAVVIVGNYDAIAIVDPNNSSKTTPITTLRNSYKKTHTWFTGDQLGNGSYIVPKASFALSLTSNTRRRLVQTTPTITLTPGCDTSMRCPCTSSCNGM
jgi:hypothetical protein